MALIPQIDNGLQLSQNRQKTLPSKTYKLVHDVIASKLQLNEPSVVVADFITLNDIAYDKFSMKPVGTSYQETRDEVPGTAVSGEDITITDAQVLPLHKFNIEGKSVQETRAGNNFVDLAKISSIAWGSASNGVITSESKTAEAYANQLRIDFSEPFNVSIGSEYYLSFDCKVVSGSAEKINTVELFNSDNVNVGGMLAEVANPKPTSTYQRYVYKIKINGNDVRKIYIQSYKANEFIIEVKNIMISNENIEYEEYGAMPSIKYPSDIQSVGDNINVLPNTATTQTINGVVFTVNSDGTVIANGTATANTNLTVAQNTELNDGEEYILSGCPTGGSDTKYAVTMNQYYESASHYIQDYGNGASFVYNELSANTNSVYIRIVSGATLNNLLFQPKISKKSGAYSPYGQGSIEIYNCNKNLFNLDDFTETSAGVTITKTGDTFVLNGTATNNNTLVYTPPEILKLLGDYTLSVKYISGTKSGTCNFNIRDYNTNSGIIGTNLTTSDTYNTKTFEETTQIRFGMYINGGSTFTDYTFKVQLEKGLTATEYLEHQEQTKALYTQQPFRAIGDVKDRFVKQNGVWYEEHKIEEIILNGTEGWSNLIMALKASRISTTLPNPPLATDGTRGKLISSHFVYNTDYNSDVIGNCFVSSVDNGFYVYPMQETKEEFITWLSENNVTLDYILATPNLIECTPEQVEQLEYLNSEFKTYEGINHITTTDDVKPTLSFTYNFIPALPSPEAESPIISTGDNINLFDKDNANILKAFPNEDTLIISAHAVAKILFIECEGDMTYTLSKIPTTRFQVWDSVAMPAVGVKLNKVLTRDYNFTGAYKTVKTSENAKYLVFYYYNTSSDTISEEAVINSIKICKGTSTVYSPYRQGSVEVNIRNKNWLPVLNETTVTQNGITIKPNGDGTYTANGTSTGVVTYRITTIDGANSYTHRLQAGKYVGVCENTAYTTHFMQIALKDDVAGEKWFNTSPKISFETNGGTYQALIYIRSGVTLNNFIFKPMITLETDENLEYVEHQSQTKILYTQQPFRSIGDIRDRFVKIDGIWYEEHLIGEIILDGTQGNMYAEPEIGRYDYKIPNAKMKGLCASTHFAYKFAVENGKIFLSGAQSNRLGVTYNEMKTLESMNAWLAENQVIIDYELDKPLLIQCTQEQIAILEEQDINSDLIHIYSTDEIPTDIEVTYYSSKDVQMVNANSDRIVGYADGLEAVKQSIFHILNVERYAYIIYNNNYGVELEQYIGADINYIEATIENTLKEALTYDLRIKDVKVQSVTQITHDIVLVNFICYTIYGDLVMEVNINV